MTVVQLRAAGVSVVLDVEGPALPRVLHWGRDPGPLDDTELRGLATASVAPVPQNGIDLPVTLTLLPSELDGWLGTPGVTGQRSGGDSLPVLTLTGPVEVSASSVRAVGSGSGLEVTVELELDTHGLLRVRTSLTNTGDGVFDVDGVTNLLPLPGVATEVLSLTGRWCRERAPQRLPLAFGTHVRTGRRGRSGHDAPLLLTAGTPGFGFRSGEVWGVHAAWSGESTHLAERLPESAGSGAAVLGAGESLRAGAVRLAPGETYAAPETVFAWSDEGLDGMSRRVHRMLRSRPHHPRTPRPVVLNIWEAVYFDHDLTRLRTLADVASSVGVERFVIDDGWFGSRRDDTSGLGDWWVSPDVWPDGLGPIVDHVHGLGMQVGLWFEPEMANLDSELVRKHPDWLLTPDAPVSRHQQVVDLANDDAYAYILERLDSVIGEYGIDFVKWDHNRDLHVALHDTAGVRVPGARAQTLALYRLLDELRARHPRLEVESCASGGGRVDLGILEHTDRVWTSDNNDSIERQAIQRWTGVLLPAELMGAHVGPTRNHTTGRILDLQFRCVTALFGHAGIEWDITSCTDAELDTLRRWTALYREHRSLLHSGDVVRADLADPSALLHGVVSGDGSAGLFAYVQVQTTAAATPGRVRIPGLDRDRSYRVRVRDDLGLPPMLQKAPPPWLPGGVTLPGSVLADAGLQMPVLMPASALLIELTPA